MLTNTNIKNDVLVRYLLDEMVSIEEDHSDALAPVQGGFDISRAGEASLVAPLTAEEFRLHSQQHNLALSSMGQRLSRMERQIYDSFRHLSYPIDGQPTSKSHFPITQVHNNKVTNNLQMGS
jgi:hypothetical protein